MLFNSDIRVELMGYIKRETEDTNIRRSYLDKMDILGFKKKAELLTEENISWLFYFLVYKVTPSYCPIYEHIAMLQMLTVLTEYIGHHDLAELNLAIENIEQMLPARGDLNEPFLIEARDALVFRRDYLSLAMLGCVTLPNSPTVR